MYIKTTKSKGHEYLYLVEEVYQQGAKKTLLLERLGRTDLIAPKTLDTIRSHSVDGRKYTVANIERNLSGILPAILGQARSELANDDEPNQERNADDDAQGPPVQPPCKRCQDVVFKDPAGIEPRNGSSTPFRLLPWQSVVSEQS